MFKTLLLVLAITVGAAACEPRPPPTQEQLAQWRMLSEMDRVARDPRGLPYSISYFKDSRPTPPLCFAYTWLGGSYGGPVLATVPCEAVESLLVNK